MTRSVLTGAAVVAMLALLAITVVVGRRTGGSDLAAVAAPVSTALPPVAPVAVETPPAEPSPAGFLYGRVTTVDGAVLEGRLRWGNGEEAFWSDYFNGAKEKNPWAAFVPPDRIPRENNPLKVLGITVAKRERTINLGRLFMARFGDISRIEARADEVRVTLKDGTGFDLDRFEASDFDDGIRVWDGRRGVVDLDSLRIRTIEFLPTPALSDLPSRLHGTVSTRHGRFTGHIQWDREECVGSDELDGRTPEGDLRLRFETIRAVARESAESARVTLADGREVVLSDSADVSRANRGLYVDDPRYGRVLVSWDAFERADFTPGGSGPGYDEFAAARPITGSVTTRSGLRLAGRLVYDLDESITVETLDAPSKGVDYTIPFGLVSSIVLPGSENADDPFARVTLRDGEELRLERRGDLGVRNAGVMIFVDGRDAPEYLLWTEVERIDFDRPAGHPATVSAVRSLSATP